MKYLLKIIVGTLIGFGFLVCSFSYKKSGHFNSSSGSIDSILQSHPEWFSKITANPEKYRIQIIYTQINRDANNVPSFKQYDYLVDSSNYFYCASLVKLPCSILALEKLNGLGVKGLTRSCRMITDSAGPCQKKILTDTSSQNGFPSLEHYIKKMLLVSDNQAYGRVYEFLSPDYIHQRLSQLSYPGMRIVHRFDGGCMGMEHFRTNPVGFYDENGKLLYQQEQQISSKTYTNPLGKKIEVGKAHINVKGKKINEPKDFSALNYISLQNINDILKALVFQPYVSKEKKYSISEEDRKFLLKYLCMYPRESDYPKYNPSTFYDAYKKYFMYGDSKKTISDTTVRIFNIVGQSYGFMVDCAYIVDFKNKTEFMLSAVIYTNENEIMNDGIYEYKTIALPYLSKLGSCFYEYEVKRKKKCLPDLTDFNHF